MRNQSTKAPKYRSTSVCKIRTATASLGVDYSTAFFFVEGSQKKNVAAGEDDNTQKKKRARATKKTTVHAFARQQSMQVQENPHVLNCVQ